MLFFICYLRIYLVWFALMVVVFYGCLFSGFLFLLLLTQFVYCGFTSVVFVTLIILVWFVLDHLMYCLFCSAVGCCFCCLFDCCVVCCFVFVCVRWCYFCLHVLLVCVLILLTFVFNSRCCLALRCAFIIRWFGF